MSRCEGVSDTGRTFYDRHRWNQAATECVRCGEPAPLVKKLMRSKQEVED